MDINIDTLKSIPYINGFVNDTFYNKFIDMFNSFNSGQVIGWFGPMKKLFRQYSYQTESNQSLVFHRIMNYLAIHNYVKCSHKIVCSNCYTILDMDSKYDENTKNIYYTHCNRCNSDYDIIMLCEWVIL